MCQVRLFCHFRISGTSGKRVRSRAQCSNLSLTPTITDIYILYLNISIYPCSRNRYWCIFDFVAYPGYPAMRILRWISLYKAFLIKYWALIINVYIVAVLVELSSLSDSLSEKIYKIENEPKKSHVRIFRKVSQIDHLLFFIVEHEFLGLYLCVFTSLLRWPMFWPNPSTWIFRLPPQSVLALTCSLDKPFHKSPKLNIFVFKTGMFWCIACTFYVVKFS